MALPLLPRHDHASCHRHGNGHGDFTVPARWTPQTVNNDNSSRFAKCMQICFTDKMSVGGAEIQTSLLEKSRVNAFFQYERNYHSFYMLCYYKHKKGCKDKKGRPIDNTNAESMLGAKAYGHCKSVKEYDCLANGDNMLSPEGDMEWYQRVVCRRPPPKQDPT